MNVGPTADHLRIQIKITEVESPLIVMYWAASVDVTVQDLGEGVRRETFVIPIKDINQIDLTMQGKQEIDTKIDGEGQILRDAKFELEDIWVDGILMEKWALSPLCKFYPSYTKSQKLYAAQSGQPLEEFLQDEWTFYFNGRWTFDLSDFFMKYHQILTAGLDHYNHWVKQSHLGYIDSARFAELEKILQTI